MIFAGAATARSSLAARLDISNPGCSTVEIDTPIIRRNPPLRYCHAGYKTHACRVSRSQKSEPGCPGSPLAHPVGDGIRTRVSYDAGIRTVSTTWITPFDWLTL